MVRLLDRILATSNSAARRVSSSSRWNRWPAWLSPGPILLTRGQKVFQADAVLVDYLPGRRKMIAASPRGLLMMSCRSGSLRYALSAALMFASLSYAHAGVVLITVDEARLPAPQQVAFSRGITRAPRIELSPIDDGQLRSPIHFKLTFRAFGGSTIDLNSLNITYLRSSGIDLTPRVRPYASAQGIDIPDAEAPPGEHLIKVTITDSEGRQGVSNFTLTVAPD